MNTPQVGDRMVRISPSTEVISSIYLCTVVKVNKVWFTTSHGYRYGVKHFRKLPRPRYRRYEEFVEYYDPARHDEWLRQFANQLVCWKLEGKLAQFLSTNNNPAIIEAMLTCIPEGNHEPQIR